MRILPLVLAGFLWPAAAVAQSVTIEQGNVHYRAPGEFTGRPLTCSGRDRDARLSPGGGTITFIRGTPRDSVETALGREEATSLWIIRSDGSGERMLARGRASSEPSRALAAFQAPWFSPDGERIYFLSSAWVTSAAVHAVEVATGSERFVAPGNSLEVVPRGQYAGHLLVSQHRYFIAAGSYDWIWLLTPDGREVGPVGEDEASLAEFREMYVDP